LQSKGIEEVRIMKLYYSPRACSLSPHIVLRELGLPFQLERVDLKAKKTESGADFAEINPKGYVPVLELDDGRRLTEGPAVIQYLGDLKPDSRLVPPATAFERYQLQEWLNFIGTELHKRFSVFFNPNASEEWKETTRADISRRLAWVDSTLGTKTYLMGDVFTAADAYLYTVLRWAQPNRIELEPWPKLAAYYGAIDKRPRVREALKAEGLL
jgi:glutathione S-transferase